MNRNYMSRRDFDLSPDWALTHETHPAVAIAIHAIADSKRSPEEIWEAPTRDEWDHVTIAVEEYILQGDFPEETDGRYQWGLETITIPQPGLLKYEHSDVG